MQSKIILSVRYVLVFLVNVYTKHRMTMQFEIYKLYGSVCSSTLCSSACASKIKSSNSEYTHSALLTRRIDCAEYFVSWYFMDVLQQTVSVFVGRSTKGQTMHTHTHTLPSMAKLVVFYTLIIKLHIAHIKHT